VKKVLQLLQPTPGLAAFLKDYPAGTWNEFRDFDGSGAYKELVYALLDKQRSLCPYCEIDLTDNDRQIEHFHPKSDDLKGANYWNFQVANLFAVVDDLILNPVSLPVVPAVFSVNFAGEIHVAVDNCHASGANADRATATIDELNLNCRRLMNARAGVWEELQDDFIQRIEDGESDEAALGGI